MFAVTFVFIFKYTAKFNETNYKSVVRNILKMYFEEKKNVSKNLTYSHSTVPYGETSVSPQEEQTLY